METPEGLPIYFLFYLFIMTYLQYVHNIISLISGLVGVAVIKWHYQYGTLFNIQ